MKQVLRVAAAILFGLALAFWLIAGANPAWTRTSVEVKTLDEVTGLERIEWNDTFVPGVDFLAVSAVAAAILAGTSFLFRNKKIGNRDRTG